MSVSPRRRLRFPGHPLLRRLALGLVLVAAGMLLDRVACAALRAATLYEHLGEVRELLIAAKFLGSGLGAAVLGGVVWALDRRRWRRAVVLWLVAAVAGLGAVGLKVATGRERPSHDIQPIGGERVLSFHGPARGLDEAGFRSFPSGHTTGAFAAATCLAAFYPPARSVVYVVAVVAGINRVVEHEHFLSDVAAGGLLGHLVALWMLSRGRLRRLWCGDRVDRARAPS